MISHYDLDTLVAIARELSPYYRELYQGLPSRPSLEQLPIVDQQGFWAANTQKDNRLLTGPLHNGIIFKTGGSTGAPKFSVYSRIEWDAFTAVFGMGLEAGGLTEGERIGNLFYVGDLYSSFIFLMRSLDQARPNCLQIPLSGRAEPDTIEHAVDEFQITTLAGTTTTLLNLARHYRDKGRQVPGIRRLLFAGESMYRDQRLQLAETFPNASMNSIGYASVDAGLLGYADASCDVDEHRMFSSYAQIEIISEESGQPIKAANKVGRVVVTNFTRLLMPIIRYPAGDRACWTEEAGLNPDRRFRLMGRSEEGARIGPVALYVQDVRRVLDSFQERIGPSDFQLLISHENQLDKLRIRIAANPDPHAREAIAAEIIQQIHQERPLFLDLANQGLIHQMDILWVAPGELEINPRTGKLNRILDRRHEQH